MPVTALDATILVNFVPCTDTGQPSSMGTKRQFFVWCDIPGPKYRLHKVHGTQLYSVISRGVFSIGDVES